MYTEFDSLLEANEVFCCLSKSTVFPWSAIMAAHGKLGLKDGTFQIYSQMRLSAIEPDEHIYVSVVKACSDNLALAQGMQVHAHILDRGFESNIFVGNILISLYMRCGQPADGCVVFNRLPKRDIVSWNAMIAGYVHIEPREAIKFYCQLQQEGNVAPDKATLFCVLQACSIIAFLQQGREIHSYIIESGCVFDAEIGNALIVMYGKCGSLEDAQMVFEKLITHGIMPWGSLIAAYAEHGYEQQALCIFKKMQKVGCESDAGTFVCVLNLCCNPTLLNQGRSIHVYAAHSGVDQGVFISNALIDMY
eukprot:c24012_g1_i4 orf=1-915(-)